MVHGSSEHGAKKRRVQAKGPEQTSSESETPSSPEQPMQRSPETSPASSSSTIEYVDSSPPPRAVHVFGAVSSYQAYLRHISRCRRALCVTERMMMDEGVLQIPSTDPVIHSYLLPCYFNACGTHACRGCDQEAWQDALAEWPELRALMPAWVAEADYPHYPDFP
jgi:hypothetical protein